METYEIKAVGIKNCSVKESNHQIAIVLQLINRLNDVGTARENGKEGKTVF